MANRRGKKKCTPTEPSCSMTDCNDPSTDIFTCSTCKSPYHITCSNLDAELIPILERNTNEGLTWYARCNACVENGIPDPASLKPLILDISNTISCKIDEFRALIDMSSLLDIGNTLKSKVTDFESAIEKSGLVVPTTPNPVHANSVEVQTDRNGETCSIASQTIYPSKPVSFVPPPNTLSIEPNVPTPASSRPRQVCPHYKRGKCRHGASGKLLIDGKECPFIHPRKCLKYCRYGSDITNGCVGPCEYFHPYLCKNSVNSKECLIQNCTFAHLAGTKRTNSISPDKYEINSRYFHANHKTYSAHQFPPSVDSAWNPSYQSDFYKQTLPRQSSVRRELHHATSNNFPPLPSKDDPKITQNAVAINELQNSINFLMQNAASSKQICHNGISSQQAIQDFSSNNPAASHVHQTETGIPKNYARPYQPYAVR